MKTIESQRSATILQFPRGGRAALAAARTAAEAYPSLPKMVIGGRVVSRRGDAGRAEQALMQPSAHKSALGLQDRD